MSEMTIPIALSCATPPRYARWEFGAIGATVNEMSVEEGMAPATREERLATNEVFFRSVNEAIEQQAMQFGGLDAYEFICECDSSECFDRITLTLSQYEHIRRVGTRFGVAPGHVNVAIEQLVESTPSYDIVEKDGAAGVVAEFSDPRDGDVEH